MTQRMYLLTSVLSVCLFTIFSSSFNSLLSFITGSLEGTLLELSFGGGALVVGIFLSFNSDFLLSVPLSSSFSSRFLFVFNTFSIVARTSFLIRLLKQHLYMFLLSVCLYAFCLHLNSWTKSIFLDNLWVKTWSSQS